ncbi:TRAP transporter small permease [Paroceanicella profunda]|uniref:TRAP transporter small permease protein n=2 Tax=Paroceanicella profunda TaxID=2579971 RepID=A0A5B8FV48_9RHOB|nr:TRAP transporter small permease [Paroceanicella profunda]
MSMLITAVDLISRFLFLLAILITAALVFIVTYDVGARNLGLTPPNWAVNTVEYGMLHITFLALPWLVRTRGHVCVELVLTYLPARARTAWELALHAISALICFYLAYRSGLSLADTIAKGSYEVRSFDMPMWMLFASMPAGFLLGGLQFVAFPLRGDSFFAGAAAEKGGL